MEDRYVDHSMLEFINCNDPRYKHTSHGWSRLEVPFPLAVSFFLFEHYYSHYFRSLILWWPLLCRSCLMRMIRLWCRIPRSSDNRLHFFYRLVSWILTLTLRSLLLLVQRGGDDELTDTVAMLDRIDTSSESKDLLTKIIRITSMDINSMCRGIIGGSGGLHFCTRTRCSTTAHKQQEVVLDGKIDRYYISGLRGGQAFTEPHVPTNWIIPKEQPVLETVEKSVAVWKLFFKR